MRRIFIAAITATLLVGTSCDKKSVTPTIDNRQIMPLQTGRQWWGTQTSIYGEYTQSVTMAYIVDSMTTVNNEAWYHISYYIDTFKYDPILMLTNRVDGLWIWYTGNDSPGGPAIWAPYPAAVGDTVTTDRFPIESIRVEAIDTIIEVPAGIFKCYHYFIDQRSIINSGPLHRYFTPGIGLIKVELFEYFIIPPGSTIWTLDSVVQK